MVTQNSLLLDRYCAPTNGKSGEANYDLQREFDNPLFFKCSKTYRRPRSKFAIFAKTIVRARF